MHMTQIFLFKSRLHVIVSVIILRSKKIGYTYTSSLALYYIFAKLPHLHTLVFSICQRHKDTFRWQGCTCSQDCSRRHMSQCSCCHNFLWGSLNKCRRRWVTIALKRRWKTLRCEIHKLRYLRQYPCLGLGCVTSHWQQQEQEHQGCIKCGYALHMWGHSSATISSLHNSIHPPEIEINHLKTTCGCPCVGVIKNR